MMAEEAKTRIRQFVLDLGVDDVGFANIKDYSSPRSPKIETIFPTARSMVVMAFKRAPTAKARPVPLP